MTYGSPASLMDETDRTLYNAFIRNVKESSLLSGSSKEVLNVVAGLGQGMIVFGDKMLVSISPSLGGMFPLPTLSQEPRFVRTLGPLSNRWVNYAYSTTQSVLLDSKACDGSDEDSCRIHLDIDIELYLTSAPSPEEGATFAQLLFLGPSLKVTKLTAHNAYASLELVPGEGVFTADALQVQAAFTDATKDVLSSADIAAEGLLIRAGVKAQDRQNTDVQVSAVLNAGVGSLETALGLAKPLEVGVTTLDGFEFSGTVDVAATDASAEIDLVLDAAIQGNGPFNYVFGKTLQKQNEDASNYLALDATAGVDVKLAGSTVLTGEAAGDRAHEVLSLNAGQLVYGDRTYAASAQLTETGEVIALDATDPVSGVRVVVSTENGVTAGRVLDAAGNQLGTIAKVDKKLQVTYAE